MSTDPRSFGAVATGQYQQTDYAYGNAIKYLASPSDHVTRTIVRLTAIVPGSASISPKSSHSGSLTFRTSAKGRASGTTMRRHTLFESACCEVRPTNLDQSGIRVCVLGQVLSRAKHSSAGKTLHAGGCQQGISDRYLEPFRESNDDLKAAIELLDQSLCTIDVVLRSFPRYLSKCRPNISGAPWFQGDPKAARLRFHGSGRSGRSACDARWYAVWLSVRVTLRSQEIGSICYA